MIGNERIMIIIWSGSIFGKMILIGSDSIFWQIIVIGFGSIWEGPNVSLLIWQWFPQHYFGILMHLYYFISVNCQWSAWGWSGCSKTCGYGGVKYGTRRKVRHARNGGRRCSGSSRRSIRCMVRRSCRGIKKSIQIQFLPNEAWNSS